MFSSLRSSVFNHSHEYKFTSNMGELVPVLCKQLHPGDSIKLSLSALIRTQPLLAPVMHKEDVVFHVWSCANRILQINWTNFITGGLDGLDATVPPTITVNTGTGWAVGSLADHFGFPVGVDDIKVSAFPFRAYATIWNLNYRDEQLQTALTVSLGDGADTTTNTTLQFGCWQKDYFTSARPNAQLGSAVAVPLTGNAPVTGGAPVLGFGPVDAQATVAGQQIRQADGSSVTVNAWAMNSAGVRLRASGSGGAGASNYPVLEADADSAAADMEADLSGVSAVSIDELREVNAFQRFKEKNNRGGARYPEWLRSFFHVNPSDKSLNEPQFLGSIRSTIQFSEVLQTGPTDTGTTPLATMGGHGISSARGHTIRYKAEEHCVLLVLMCVRPKTEYSQGIPREWMYEDKYDYLIPDFANLGDQEIKLGEIYAQGTSADYDTVFGYAPKYQEMRSTPSRTGGEFRPGQTLDYWTQSRYFASAPALNSTFVKCVPDDRIFATTTEDQLQNRVMFNFKIKRALPKVAHPYLY